MTAKQLPLEFFPSQWEVKSDSGNHKYVVRCEKDIWTCTCPASVYRPQSHCKHIMQAINNKLRTENDYLKGRKEPVSHSHFKSFEAVQEWFIYKDNPELGEICNVILSIGKSEGSVTADDVHGVIKSFEKDPRIIGTAFGILKRNGLLRAGPYEKSRRKECHGRPIVRYYLSDDGKRLVV